MNERKSVMDTFGTIHLSLDITIKPPKDEDAHDAELDPDKVIHLHFGGRKLFTAEEEPYIPLLIEALMAELNRKVVGDAKTDFL